MFNQERQRDTINYRAKKERDDENTFQNGGTYVTGGLVAPIVMWDYTDGGNEGGNQRGWITR